MKIIGAGLAGLIAAQVFQDATIIERNKRSTGTHKALLRFRTPNIGKLFGIEFKEVEVYKGIYMDGKFHEPNIQLNNLYSQKVLGRIEKRSIMDIKPVKRWIAPDNFYELILERNLHRVRFETEHDWSDKSEPVISTAPLPVALRACGIEHNIQFKSESIYVKRFELSDCNINQTIYYPGNNTSVYRASIVGNILIQELMEESEIKFPRVLSESFGIVNADKVNLIGNYTQDNGKISPVDDSWRKSMLYKLTSEHNVYSLGRFATWRNILLDDVYEDCFSIKKLINLGAYEHHKGLS